MAQTTKPVTFLEELDVIDKVDRLAKEQGTDRSAFIRGALREKIRREEASNDS
jgi:metal-responsive CopG/Arc/MetJ family transcriptional regulator